MLLTEPVIRRLEGTIFQEMLGDLKIREQCTRLLGLLEWDQLCMLAHISSCTESTDDCGCARCWQLHA
jgi:hypothetical protein